MWINGTAQVSSVVRLSRRIRITVLALVQPRRRCPRPDVSMTSKPSRHSKRGQGQAGIAVRAQPRVKVYAPR